MHNAFNSLERQQHEIEHSEWTFRAQANDLKRVALTWFLSISVEKAVSTTTIQENGIEQTVQSRSPANDSVFSA